MKTSNYNCFVHYEPDKTFIGYNCVSGGMYIFDNEQYIKVNEILKNPKNVIGKDWNCIKEKLVKGRFLIDDDLDELQLLKLRNNMARHNPNGLGVVIAPTLSCNFDCPYCYVDREKISMDQKRMNAVRMFFSKKLEKTDKISVAFTGGEPIIALDVVENLSGYLLGESKKQNKEFSCSMVTNGYLLTPDVIDRLKACGIQTLQITLDGYGDYHDKLRYTIGGGKTYSKIVKNLVAASKSGLRIILRSNVEKDNFQGIYNLIDDLAGSEIDKNNIYFVPCMVMDVKTSKGNYCGNCFNKDEFAQVEPEIILYSIKKGFKISKEIFSTLRTFCGANTLSMYVVDSYANVLKCWCNLGRAEKNKIGHINDDGDLVFSDYKNFAKWMTWDPFEIKECRNCKVLPICMGGCMYYNIMGETNEIGIGCSLRRHNLDEIIKIYYLSVTKNLTQLEQNGNNKGG